MTLGINSINPFTAFDERATAWGAKEWMAQRLDSIGNKINIKNKRISSNTELSSTNLQQLFRLELSRSPQWGDIFHPSQYRKQVSKNLKYFNNSIKDGLHC